MSTTNPKFVMTEQCSGLQAPANRSEVIDMSDDLLSRKDKSRILSLRVGETFTDADGDQWRRVA